MSCSYSIIVFISLRCALCCSCSWEVLASCHCRQYANGKNVNYKRQNVQLRLQMVPQRLALSETYSTLLHTKAKRPSFPNAFPEILRWQAPCFKSLQENRTISPGFRIFRDAYNGIYAERFFKEGSKENTKECMIMPWEWNCPVTGPYQPFPSFENIIPYI